MLIAMRGIVAAREPGYTILATGYPTLRLKFLDPIFALEVHQSVSLMQESFGVAQVPFLA